MIKLDYVIGWDNTTFPMPGRISRIARVVLNQGIVNIVATNNKVNKLSLHIIIGGQESIVRLSDKKLRKNAFQIKINVKRTFYDSVDIEGERLGIDIVNKLESAINSILSECKL